MEITTETTSHIDTDELVDEIRSDIESIAEEVIDNRDTDSYDSGRIDDLEDDMRTVKRNQEEMRYAIDRICGRIDELEDAISETADDDALLVQTLSVLGMIDKALRPPATEQPTDIW